MADLIALLLVVLGEFLAPGVDAGVLAAQLDTAVEQSQAVPVASAMIKCEGVAQRGLDSIEFNLSELLLDPLLIDEARITVSDIEQSPAARITIGGIKWQAEISQEHLTQALRSDVKTLSDTWVTIDKSALTLSGTYPVWRIRVPYKVSGTLNVERQTQLMFHIDQTGLSGVRVPAKLNQYLESEINPVYDLADFTARSKKDIKLAKESLDYDFYLQVKQIKLADGLIIVSGDA